MLKNTSGQKLIVYVFDSTSSLPKTGDAANLTAYVSKDYGAVTVLGDTTATEMDATNAKGYYLFDLTQAETNADTLLFSGKSSTANMVVLAMPATVYTTPPLFTSLSIDASGRVDLGSILGTAVSTPATAGILDVNVKNINNATAATPGANGGILIAGSNAATTFATLTVTGATTLTGNVSMAAGLTITQSTTNSSGLSITGNGTGHGVVITSGSGATGDGLHISTASTNGNGIYILASGSGDGAVIIGGATGNGIHATGGSTSGNGCLFDAALFGHGIQCNGTGSTRHGAYFLGGSTTSAGICCEGGSTSGDGILCLTTSGHGISLTPTGSSKYGLNIVGGNAGTSDGVKITAGTGGVGLRIDTSTITGAIDWADFLTDIAGTRLKVNTGVIKNTALSAFAFKMIDSSDHISAKAGLGTAVTATRSIDGAAFAACANTVTELANGFYLIDLANTDLNGNVITLRFIGTGADPREITVLTTT